jgi:protein TonB
MTTASLYSVRAYKPLLVGILLLCVGCAETSKILPVPKIVLTPIPTVPPPAVVVVVEEKKPVSSLVSSARSPTEYRKDAAKHIYKYNQHRILQGKLPPLLYAIGVVTFEVQEDGRIHSFDWMRQPKQAPEVIQEIERTIKAAEPYPAPIHLGRVRYTETWLWHKSGKFQLDTLTEGQI